MKPEPKEMNETFNERYSTICFRKRTEFKENLGERYVSKVLLAAYTYWWKIVWKSNITELYGPVDTAQLRINDSIHMYLLDI